MSDDERDDVVLFVSANPEAGDLLAGGGGIRKARIPGRGKGKSGGYRVVTYYMDEDEPVFLLTVISKGQQANLTAQQKQALKGSAKDEKKKRGSR